MHLRCTRYMLPFLHSTLQHHSLRISIPMKTFLILIALVVASSCTSTNGPSVPTTPAMYQLLGSASEGSTKVELYSKQGLVVGYNNLFIKVINTATNTIVTDAHVEMDCAMDMDTMHHRAPVEQCDCHESAIDNMWHAGAIFHMQGGMAAWKIRLNVHNHSNNEEISVSIPVNVAPTQNVVTFSSGLDEYVVCFVPPALPVIGKNAVNFVVFSTRDHIAYASRDDVAISIEPHMPSMGHGSPGNVQPVGVGAGHFAATVNLIMKGSWVISTTVTRADGPLGSFDFPISL